MHRSAPRALARAAPEAAFVRAARAIRHARGGIMQQSLLDSPHYGVLAPQGHDGQRWAALAVARVVEGARE